jgi:hypothetical protein
MKLPFEEWTLQKGFSNNVSKLFNESFICYRNTAYRASLLFSYLSFLTILKETIIKAAKPTLIPQGRWDCIIRKLQSDDSWEKAVFEELTNSSSPIFNINEDLRQQIKYWKDRRNDCAHFKSNDIEAHHIESFWSFLKSNLSKVTIEGGKDSLLNKFEKHFDPTFTPPDADYTHLIKEIDESIIATELTDFWAELISKIDNYSFLFQHESTGTRLVNKVFEYCNDDTKESLSNFLKSQKYDLTIVSLFPDKINFIGYSPAEIREIWRTRIWNNKSSAFGIYGTLLRNSLIPTTEISEANNYVIDKATDYRPNDETTHLALAANGFGDAIFDIAIHTKRLKDWFVWVNPRADMIAYYIEKYPLKDETVEVICEMYSREKYSYWLGERIVRIFTENANKKNEFHLIATRNSLTIPSELA